MKRRSFLKQTFAGSALITAGSFPLQALEKPEFQKVTILHTNDVHSRIDAFPMDGGKYEGMGGVARRANLIKKIRAKEEHVLLFDSGDIFQGTPYFNYFGGEVEFKLMSAMQYDAATLGNHDFDNGIDGLLKQLPHAKFPFVIGNYDFSNTPMNEKTKPYQVFKKGDIKIGVFGVGIELLGLVPQTFFGKTRYLDPISSSNKIAAILKKEEECDYVICLSHLGFEYTSGKISDHTLAENSKHIDLILGGHTHTFLDIPASIKNKAGKEVLINQAGWGGIILGRLDIHFERTRKGKCISCKNHLISQQLED